MTETEFVRILIRRGLVTSDLDEAERCCGQPRDEDGFCVYRPHHPIYYGGPTVDALKDAAIEDAVARCRRCATPATCGEFGRCALEQVSADG